MTGVTPNDVRTLRERTGAGMMDCKKALVESNGNIEQAIDLLRKKGLVAAAKKADRITAEGLVGVFVDESKGTLVEVNTETDFVARNDMFQKYVDDILKIANEKSLDLESLKSASYPNTDRTVSEELTNLISIIGENMTLRRICHFSVDNGVVASYVHNKITPNMGKIGILVGVESTGDSAKLMEFGKQVAMHIAAANPQSTSIDDLDPSVLAREKDIVTEQAKNMGKPAEFIEKIVEGRIRKFYEEAVLLEQVFVIDGATKIKDVAVNLSKEIGAPVAIKGFEKFVLGEGIEKKEVDFAADVAAQLG